MRVSVAVNTRHFHSFCKSFENKDKDENCIKSGDILQSCFSGLLRGVKMKKEFQRKDKKAVEETRQEQVRRASTGHLLRGALVELRNYIVYKGRRVS